MQKKPDKLKISGNFFAYLSEIHISWIVRSDQKMSKKENDMV
jgi:hypothetical protein